MFSEQEIRTNEVLGLNLSREDRASVQRYATAGDLRAGDARLPNLNLTVTRIPAGPGGGALNLFDALTKQMPSAAFTFNYNYHNHLRAVPAIEKPAPAGEACPSDRCYGTGLINWRVHLSACATNIKVGVIDTGYDRAHPAFEGRKIELRGFGQEHGSRAPNEHGTGILSLLAGNPQSATPGLIPHAHFLVADTFDADRSGQALSDTLSLLQALEWMAERRVDVLNMSLAGPEDGAVHDALKTLHWAGTTIVAAGGNDGPGIRKAYPAAYAEVIGVTAVDRGLASYRYANRGDHIELAAPGVDIWTALPGRRAGMQTGTSFAAPYVTAAIAAIHARAPSEPFNLALRTKAALLERLNPRNLGPKITFGRGLVQAPRHCGPGERDEVAAARAKWPGVIQKISLDRGPD